MKSKLSFLLSMVIFGTIGVFVRHIDLASSEIALIRGLLGSVFLVSVMALLRKRVSWPIIRANGLFLLLSSVALSLNWIFLFQSFKYTTIANATLSYYFAPVFVMLLSPLLLKERLSLKKVLCIGTAIVGMFLIVTNQGTAGSAGDYNHVLGITFGLLAAVFYAALVLSNKFIKNQDGLETTLVQIALASMVLLPYVILTEGFSILQLDLSSVPYILILGFLHTGVGFFLFFSSMQRLKGQTMAALSYVDPLTSLLISLLILRESMAAMQLVGGALLLGATFISEMRFKVKSINRMGRLLIYEREGLSKE
jgi:RarD protein